MTTAPLTKLADAVTNESSAFASMAASVYTYDELADLYNQTRVDYIVPMPMDGQRMAEYVKQYEVDLDASTIGLMRDGSPCGIIMLGLRGKRSWITRLGILPDKRGYKAGQHLMEISIEKSRQLNVDHVQLEVIKGNTPALQLFRKLGFVEIGELMVIRRPPGALNAVFMPSGASVDPLDSEAIERCLAQRVAKVAWTEESSSILRAGNLKGLRVTLPSGEQGWLVCQHSAFQLTHLVFSENTSVEMAQALLFFLHKSHPFHDTKVENVPRGHSSWSAFQQMGYLEAFGRIEMCLTF